MPERYSPQSQSATRRRSEFEGKLRIDEDDIDSCLVEQPELFYHVADALALANAVRDTLKLQLEEKTAELDRQVRAEYARLEEKVTEAGITNQLRILPVIQTLRRDFLDASTNSDRWDALKQAYSQRSFMLRELNGSQISKLHNLSLERGAGSARARMGDEARQRGEDQRRDRRLQR